MTKSPALEAAAKETTPDRCIICDGMLPDSKRTGRKRTRLCGLNECRLEYMRVWSLDRGARARALRAKSRARRASSFDQDY